MTIHDDRTITRFWQKIKRGDSFECWEWIAFRDKDGYGQFRTRKPRRMRKASIIAYEIEYGPTNGLLVCHLCDNPPCCNPGHLWLGTQKNNMEDTVKKNRIAKQNQNGQKNANSKLSESHVYEIRKLIANGQKNTKIAQLFNVHHATISSIRVGKTWKHIP